MAKRYYEIIATCFDKRGRVLSSGTNDYHKSHPLMKMYAMKVGESELKHFKHAELSALLKAGPNVDTILVQRFDRYGANAQAKPCKTCQEIIKAYGVKTVRYTTTDGVEEYKV